jgi:acylphosphatase
MVNKKTKRARAQVIGDVQGVGYRYFVERNAFRLSLAGFARNEFDGSVTVEVQGDEPAVHQLLDELQNGPGLAQVTEVRVQWLEPVSGQSGFIIQ